MTELLYSLPWIVLAAVGAVIYLRDRSDAIVHLSDPPSAWAEQIRAELEHEVWQAELDAWLDEVTGQ